MRSEHLETIGRAAIRSAALAAVLGLVVLTGCDGSHEKAGKQADEAAGIKPGLFREGPQQRLGKLEDRAAHAQARAIDARADALKDQAKTVRASADSQADALERQAAAVRAQARSTGKALDNRADAIRGK